MKNNLPKAPKTSKIPTMPKGSLNSFALTFDLAKRPDGKVERANMRLMFKGQAGLMDGDEPTEIGYQMLIDALADSIRFFAEQAGASTILDTNLMKQAAAERLGIVREAKRVKLIGIN